MFPAPQNYICFPVPSFFRRVFPCSPEIKVTIPLFPVTPGMASRVVLNSSTIAFVWIINFPGKKNNQFPISARKHMLWIPRRF